MDGQSSILVETFGKVKSFPERDRELQAVSLRNEGHLAGGHLAERDDY